jgi:hypothetical protein
MSDDDAIRWRVRQVIRDVTSATTLDQLRASLSSLVTASTLPGNEAKSIDKQQVLVAAALRDAQYESVTDALFRNVLPTWASQLTQVYHIFFGSVI